MIIMTSFHLLQHRSISKIRGNILSNVFRIEIGWPIKGLVFAAVPETQSVARLFCVTRFTINLSNPPRDISR